MGLLPKLSFGRVRTSTSKSDCRKPKEVFIEKKVHRVDITGSSSDIFPTWVFNLPPYGQLREVRKHPLMMSDFRGDEGGGGLK